MNASLWKRGEILARLAAHPELLEPGLVLHNQPLDLGRELLVPLHGTDALDRLCLVFFEEGFGSGFFERLLDAAARLREYAGRLETGYAHAGAGRIFVLAPGFDAAELARLEVLGAALPVDAYSVGLTREGELLVPVLSREFPRGAPVRASDWCAALPAHSTRPARRVLEAAARLRPPLQLQGAGRGPLVLVGRRGPCATVHGGRDGVVFAGWGRRIVLEDDSSADEAIDQLMREQWPTAVAGAADASA